MIILPLKVYNILSEVLKQRKVSQEDYNYFNKLLGEILKSNSAKVQAFVGSISSESLNPYPPYRPNENDYNVGAVTGTARMLLGIADTLSKESARDLKDINDEKKTQLALMKDEMVLFFKEVVKEKNEKSADQLSPLVSDVLGWCSFFAGEVEGILNEFSENKLNTKDEIDEIIAKANALKDFQSGHYELVLELSKSESADVAVVAPVSGDDPRGAEVSRSASGQQKNPLAKRGKKDPRDAKASLSASAEQQKHPANQGSGGFSRASRPTLAVDKDVKRPGSVFSSTLPLAANKAVKSSGSVFSLTLPPTSQNDLGSSMGAKHAPRPPKTAPAQSAEAFRKSASRTRTKEPEVLQIEDLLANCKKLLEKNGALYKNLTDFSGYDKSYTEKGIKSFPDFLRKIHRIYCVYIENGGNVSHLTNEKKCVGGVFKALNQEDPTKAIADLMEFCNARYENNGTTVTNNYNFLKNIIDDSKIEVDEFLGKKGAPKLDQILQKKVAEEKRSMAEAKAAAEKARLEEEARAAAEKAKLEAEAKAAAAEKARLEAEAAAKEAAEKARLEAEAKAEAEKARAAVEKARFEAEAKAAVEKAKLEAEARGKEKRGGKKSVRWGEDETKLFRSSDEIKSQPKNNPTTTNDEIESQPKNNPTTTKKMPSILKNTDLTKSK